jgi:ribonuclease T2
MLDLMPAPHLIYNEWDKHGTCSGLAPRAYFDTVRKAPDGIDSDSGGLASSARLPTWL